jgi:hypothetical protein
MDFHLERESGFINPEVVVGLRIGTGGHRDRG